MFHVKHKHKKGANTCPFFVFMRLLTLVGIGKVGLSPPCVKAGGAALPMSFSSLIKVEFEPQEEFQMPSLCKGKLGHKPSVKSPPCAKEGSSAKPSREDC